MAAYNVARVNEVGGGTKRLVRMAVHADGRKIRKRHCLRALSNLSTIPHVNAAHLQ